MSDFNHYAYLGGAPVECKISLDSSGINSVWVDVDLLASSSVKDLYIVEYRLNGNEISRVVSSRLRMKQPKRWYRVAEFKNFSDSTFTNVANSDREESLFRESTNFTRWLTERIEYE